MPNLCEALLISVLIASASLPHASAQQPTPSPSDRPIATIQTIARQVVLDVVVTDSHGRSITGLQQSDFALTEDGVPQTLNSFTEHTDASGSTLPPPLPPNTFADHAPLTGNGTITVILFDELSFVDAAYARSQVDSFIKTLNPGMPICIFKLDWMGLHLVQDFTADPRILRAAVDSKRNAPILGRPPFLAQYQPVLRQNAMQALASYLSGFSGRKNLIWFNSGFLPQFGFGFDLSGPFGDQSSFLDDVTGVVNVLTLSRVALYPVDARGLVVDPNRGFEVMAEDGELEDVASQTGGKAFYNTNGLKQAVAEIVSTGSRYYTLSYNPGNPNFDGRFRKIKIKLANNAVADATLHAEAAQLKLPLRLEYRQGYYARPGPPVPRVAAAPGTRRLIAYSPKGDPNGPDAAIATPVQRAMTFSAIAPFQILFQAHLAPAPGTEKIKRHQQPPKDNYLEPKWLHSPYREVQIHYSLSPTQLDLHSQTVDSYQGAVEFLAVVYDDYGEQVNSIATTARFDLNPNDYAQAMRAGVGLNQNIAIPTHGNYFVRLGVHDLNSGRIGVLEIPAESIQFHPAQTPTNSAR